MICEKLRLTENLKHKFGLITRLQSLLVMEYLAGSGVMSIA